MMLVVLVCAHCGVKQLTAQPPVDAYGGAYLAGWTRQHEQNFCNLCSVVSVITTPG